MIRDRETTLARKAAAFGEGHDSLYRIGANRWLLGRDVSGVSGRSSTVEVRLDSTDRFRDVRQGSGFVPARISGRVTAGQLDPGTARDRGQRARAALTRTLVGREAGQFRALVPETAFRPGANDVEVFLVEGDRRTVKLTRVDSG